MIVTRYEYEEALKICLQYKNQIDTDIKSISNENKLLVDMVNQGEISRRFYNYVCLGLDYLSDDLKGINPNLYKLSDLLKISPPQIRRLRHVGVMLMYELQQLQKKYLNK